MPFGMQKYANLLEAYPILGDPVWGKPFSFEQCALLACWRVHKTTMGKADTPC